MEKEKEKERHRKEGKMTRVAASERGKAIQRKMERKIERE